MVINAISRWYPTRFPEAPHKRRPLWRRADYPIVLPNGWPVPISRLWPLLSAAGAFTEEKDGDTVIALQGETMRFEAEVGWGTIKIVVGPHDDLHKLKDAHEAAMALLVEAAGSLGAHVMGYGIQPMTIVHPGLITKRPVWQKMHEVLEMSWLTWALTCGDQLRVGLCQDELVFLLNLANFYAPAVTALCANSPIYRGTDGYHCSGRHLLMATISGQHQRYGVFPTKFESIKDMITRFVKLPFFIQVDGEDYAAHKGTFLEYIDASQAAGMDTGALVGAYLFHETSVWPAAKLHIDDGTMSMRGACQQPWEDHMAAVALNLGIIESGWELHDFFHTHIDPPVAPRVPYGVRQPPDPPRSAWDSWDKLHAYADKPTTYGMQAREPFTGYLEGTLQICENALAARGLGEEVYLAPLWDRLRAEQSPAERIRRIFHRQGIGGMLDALAVKP